MAKSEENKNESLPNEEEEIVSFDTEELVKEEEEKIDPEIVRLTEELKAEKDNYLRLRADYENFRRRNQEATIRARQDGTADAVEAILPIIDSIDRALKISQDDKSKEGLNLIKKQIETSLSGLGVTEIETDGAAFDHNLHNAVQRAEVEESEVGKILETYQRGYKIGNKVVRYAMVKVGVEKTE